MKTVVLGAAGQLGRDLVPLLEGEVFPITRAEANLATPGAVRSLLEQSRPKVVINCAAYNLVDKAEVEPEAAFAVNVWAVRELATACRDFGCKLVQVSTDYVFGLDASRSTPLTEEDAPGPLSVYGLSKLAGEYGVRALVPEHLVVRTCGLYGIWGTGGKGGNFVETMLRVAAAGKPLRVVNDQHCTPSSTRDVAAMIVGLLRVNATGLYHATNTGGTTWHDLAAEIFRLAGVTANLGTITTIERNDPAKRPPYSVLSTAKLVRAGVPPPRSWQEALAAYLAERPKRPRTGERGT